MTGTIKLSLVDERPNKSLEEERLMAPMGNVGRSVHPVQKIQLSGIRDELKIKDKLDDITFGRHVSLRNRTERTILAQHQRLPGLPSNFIGLEAHLDLDETIEFEDYLNPKEMTPEPELGFNHTAHEVLERKLAMKF